MKIQDGAAICPGVSYDEILGALERAQDIALDHATPKTRQRVPRMDSAKQANSRH